MRPAGPGLWQAPGRINNACPLNWHVPTRDEWQAEGLGNLQDAYTKLKITAGGLRGINGAFSITVNDGLYWTSSVFNGTSKTAYSFNFSTITSPAYSSTGSVNSSGLSVRCIKD